MLDKIRQSVRTRHKLKLRWGILLRNVEDNRPLFWYTNVPASPWFPKLSETKAWLEALEESRLQGNVQRGDWLEYYNNMDVSPFLEALVKMWDFYTGLGVDIFKDTVSLPGVSMKYILRGTLRGRNAPKLYAPGPEAFEMLKGAVVGGPSLVFTRKHMAGQTRIHSHKYESARVTKHILGFNANSLYPSTMLHDMP